MTEKLQGGYNRDAEGVKVEAPKIEHGHRNDFWVGKQNFPSFFLSLPHLLPYLPTPPLLSSHLPSFPLPLEAGPLIAAREFGGGSALAPGVL